MYLHALQLSAEAAASHDTFTVDPRTGTKVFIESATKRRYRFQDDGSKAYDDEKPKKVYGGATTWMTG